MQRIGRRARLATLACAAIVGGCAMVVLRPFSWYTIRQAQTGRVLARIWCGPRHSYDGVGSVRELAQLAVGGRSLPVADLMRSHMVNARLDGTDLTWARAERTWIRCSTLTRVRLTAGHLNNSHITESVLDNVQARGVQLYSSLLQNVRMRTVDLRGADLRESVWQQVDLIAGVDLRGADLRNATFAQCDLRGARLEGALLDGARSCENVLWPASFDPEERGVRQLLQVLRPTKYQMRRLVYTGDVPAGELDGQMLRRSRLQGSVLRGTDLRGQDLRGADLSGCDLRGVALDGALYDPTTTFPGGFAPAGAGMRRAVTAARQGQSEQQPLVVAPEREWSKLELPFAVLRDADLHHSRLDGAVLCFADLRGADLRNCDLSHADLTGADVRGARLQGSRLTAATLAEVIQDETTRWPAGSQQAQAAAEGGSRSESQAATTTTN